jgi:hypothetical protein
MPEERSIFSGKLSDAELEEHWWACYDASRERFGGTGEKAIKKKWAKLFAAYGSDFLTKAEKEYLLSTERPPVEINLLTAKINAVRGSIASSRMEAVFKPHSDSDIANVKAGWMTQLVRKAFTDCGAYDEMDQVFHNDLITGYGAAELYLDTSRIPFRGILRKRSLHSLWPDPDACGMNLRDKTFDIFVIPTLVEKVLGTWGDDPEKEQKIQQHAEQWGTLGAGERSTTKRGGRSAGGSGKDSLRGKVEIALFIYQRWMKRVRWYDPERGVRRDTLREELEARRAELEKITDPSGMPLYEPIEEEEYRGETWYRAHLMLGGFETKKKDKAARGLLILDHEESPRIGSTFEWLTGLAQEEPDKERVLFFNIMDIAYGLQMVLNRTLQEELAILAREAKGGLYYAEEAVPDDYPGGEAAWIKDQSKPGSATKIAAEGWDRWKQKELPRIPPGLDRMEEKLVQWIGQAMAITDAFVGSVQQERSAVYLSNLQQQGLVTLGPVLGPYVAFIKNCGVAMAEILIRHLPTSDIDRLLDYPEFEGLTHQVNEETGEPEPMLVNDPDAPVMDETTGEQAFDQQTGEPLYEQIPITAGYVLKQENPLDYEVNVDTGQATISLRYAIWEMVEQGILQTMQNALPPKAFRHFLMFMVRNIPITGEQGSQLAKDIEKAIEEEDELQTLEGVKEYLGTLPPEQVQQALQEVAGALGIQLGGEEQPPGKPPSTSIRFSDLPPSGRVQLAAQAGIQLSEDETIPPEVPPEEMGGGLTGAGPVG